MASRNESPTNTQISSDSYFPWYRRPEQIVWAVCMTVMLSLLTRHLYLSRWQGPELIDIEQAPPLDYRFVIDINSADWPEFTVLPGISETYARRIVDVRNANGPFATIDALLSVPGIGPKRLDAIREFLIVGAGHDVVIQGSDVSSPVPGG